MVLANQNAKLTGPDQGFLVPRLVLIRKPWERGWVDIYHKVSNAVKYDSMNISLEGLSFKKSWQGEINKKFAKQFRRCYTYLTCMSWPFDDLSRHHNTIFNDLVCVVCFGN